MDFKLTEEQEAMRRMARKFAEQELAPVAGEWDEKGEFHWEVVRKLHEAGLLAVGIPEEYGGPGLDAITQALVIEEIAFGCAAVATTVAATSLLAANPILVGGSEAQKRRYCEMVNSGGLGAFALTEPGAGSDVASISTTARRVPGGYVLSGTKCFITNGGVADMYVTFATVDKTLGRRGLTCFLIEKGTPGLIIGKEENKMGIRSSNTTMLTFEELFVEDKNVVGGEGQGFRIAMESLDWSRPMVAAMAVGVAQAAYEYAVKYSKERIQFGQPIAAFQAIQFMLADMAMEIEASRLLVLKACWLRDQGLPCGYVASLAKAFASDTAMRVTTNAVQILGGYGYSKEYPVEKYMRDAKIMQIYEGTNQIQRVVIARNILRD